MTDHQLVHPVTASSPRPAGSDTERQRAYDDEGGAVPPWWWDKKPADCICGFWRDDCPAHPTAAPDTTGGELRDDEWWTRLFLASSEAIDSVPYAAGPEYPVPHAAAFRSAVEPALRALLAERDTLAEVAEERARQDAKWGEQNHPDVDQVLMNRPGGCSPLRMAQEYEIPSAGRAKFITDTAASRGEATWAAIAVEELAEAVEAAALGDELAVRTEVVQLAAVCVQWVQAIDRRALGTPTTGGGE